MAGRRDVHARPRSSAATAGVGRDRWPALNRHRRLLAISRGTRGPAGPVGGLSCPRPKGGQPDAGRRRQAVGLAQAAHAKRESRGTSRRERGAGANSGRIRCRVRIRCRLRWRPRTGRRDEPWRTGRPEITFLPADRPAGNHFAPARGGRGAVEPAHGPTRADRRARPSSGRDWPGLCWPAGTAAAANARAPCWVRRHCAVTAPPSWARLAGHWTLSWGQLPSG